MLDGSTVARRLVPFSTRHRHVGQDVLKLFQKIQALCTDDEEKLERSIQLEEDNPKRRA